jgi:hypothetical protein
MGGNTMPNMTRGRVTTPRPQQGVRGSQLIRPPAASLRPPMQKVNPPMAPFGGLNLNPMPNPQSSQIMPGISSSGLNLNTMPAPPLMRGSGFDDLMTPNQDLNSPIMTNPLQGQQIQFDDQGNPIDYDMNSMSMFNPSMMLKPY